MIWISLVFEDYVDLQVWRVLLDFFCLCHGFLEICSSTRVELAALF